ncbi:immune inhibitor A domain-containing protein [Streptomyces narbonensis]
MLNGEAKVEKRGGSQVVKLDSKKYVELGREKTDKIFTILVEFGDKVDTTTLVDREDGRRTSSSRCTAASRGPLQQPDSQAGPCERQRPRAPGLRRPQRLQAPRRPPLGASCLVHASQPCLAP